MQEPRVLSGTETEDVSRIGREWAEGEERAKEVGRRAREEAAEAAREPRGRKASRATIGRPTAPSARTVARGTMRRRTARRGRSHELRRGCRDRDDVVSAQNGATYRRGLIPRGLIPVAAIALAHAVLDVFEEAR